MKKVLIALAVVAGALGVSTAAGSSPSKAPPPPVTVPGQVVAFDPGPGKPVLGPDSRKVTVYEDKPSDIDRSARP